jgi:hypothetical protein
MTDHDPIRPAPAPADPDDAPTVTWTPPGAPGTGSGTAPAPSEPVRTAGGRSRLRWGVALVVTALVVVAGTVGVMLLTGQAAPSTVAGYAPTGSLAYGELRLDLPGDQGQQLGAFLSKFPGFADQSTLDAKIDDVLDRVVRAASDGRQDWTTKIKPWFGGQLGFSVSKLPLPDQPESARGLLILSVTDADRARAWFNEVTADLPRSESNHQDVSLTVFGEGGKSGAMAIRERTMLVGDQASVEAAIDTGGRSAFASEGRFRDALASVEGEGLGFVYLDMEQYLTWVNDLAASMPGASALPLSPAAAELLPDWTLMRVQARDDALAFESVAPHTDAMTATKNRAGVLAGHVPPSTIALFEGHDAGAALLKAVELAKQDPTAAKDIEELERQIALIGGLDGVFGWWGDTALAIARDGDDGVHGGVLIQPTDPADADRLLGVIRAGLELGGSSGITIREEDHAGTTITIVDLGDIGMLGSLFGAQAGLPPGAELPEGRVEFAYASTDDLVVLGSGPSFVRAVLDAGSGASLADDARYQALIAKAGAENVGTTFVDLAAIRELIEKLAASAPDGLAAYERDVKPYLLPLDAVVVSTRLAGDVDRGVVLVTVK